MSSLKMEMYLPYNIVLAEVVQHVYLIHYILDKNTIDKNAIVAIAPVSHHIIFISFLWLE